MDIEAAGTVTASKEDGRISMMRPHDRNKTGANGVPTASSFFLRRQSE
jgi:hypothetical protein